MRGVDLPIEQRPRAPAQTARSAAAGPALLVCLLIAAGFAAFAGGAIDPPEGSRLEMAISILGLLASAALCAGGLRVGRGPLAWLGVAMLVGFACWNGLSVSWSLAPDESWLSANAAAAYAAVAALGLVTAASTADAARLAAIGIGILGVLVAVFALGGKVAPELHLGPLDLDPGGRFARLREPLDYWNALALISVMAASPCIWHAASRRAATAKRVVAVLCLALLILVAALAYSRGALIAYAAVLAMMVGAGPRRLSRLLVGLGAPLAMAPAMLLAFERRDLSSSEVSLSERADDGALLGIVIVVSLALLASIAWALIRREPRIRWGPQQARRTWLALAAIAGALLVTGVGALALSERGLTGEVSHRVDQFQRPESRLPNTPDRLISTNGNNRYVWWQEALGAFWDNPVRGTGAGSFPVVHYLYRRYEAPVRSSHSLPLAFLSETGLVGAALGMGGLALLAAAAAGRVRSSTGAERSARLALLAAFAAWLVNSLYDWHWEIPGVTVPALIAVAVAAGPSHQQDGGRLGARRTAVAAAGTIVVAGSLAASALLPALSEDARLQALEDASAGEPLREAAANAERATELNPFSAEARFTAASIAAGRGRQLESLGELTEAARSQPDNWEAWKRLFFAYSFLGYRQRTADAYFEWARTDPLAVREQLPMTAGQVFSLRYPPSASATAFGTPPP